MKALQKCLEEMATLAIDEHWGQEYPEIKNFLPADITQSTQEQFGHYQCNSALKLSKILRLNPREVAAKIVECFSKQSQSHVLVESYEIAGPGFINIRLNPKQLSKDLQLMLQSERLGIPQLKKRQKTIVEFSSPNIAKELHVGHLRSTIIGESLARLFECLGHDVLRLNHVGDWGTQFGMLIAFIKEMHPEVFKKESIALSELMQWYKDAKKRFDTDEDFKIRAQQQVVALQRQEPDALQAWKRICAISRKGFEEIYQLLDVAIEERGESFYNPMLEEIIRDFSTRGISERSDGAEVVFMEGFETKEKTPLPLIIRKSDGGFNYATTDLAALKHRIQIEKADRIIYVVDMGQRLHFQMIFAAAQLAKYINPIQTRLDHVDFGVVLGEDGKKFKTRSGETVKLMDLLQEAIARARQVIQDRLPSATQEEIEESATTLGINAVKYADLSCHRQKDYVFSYERMLRFEGNTASFLLYSYVRIQSIKRKSGYHVDQLMKQHSIQLAHPTEIALGLHLRQFYETLDFVADQLTPHRLCEYLFELAEKFNHFFRDCHVIGSDYEASRLLLAELTAQVMQQGFHILGLKTLSKM